jgi:hypothetical protein
MVLLLEEMKKLLVDNGKVGQAPLKNLETQIKNQDLENKVIHGLIVSLLHQIITHPMFFNQL